MMSSSFVFDDSIRYDFVKEFADLVRESRAPVFVSLCTCSKFFDAEEMNMGRVVGDR